MSDKVIGLLRTIQRVYPQLRICQIISIAAGKGGWEGNDTFYCPDDILKDGFEKWIDELSSAMLYGG